MQGAERPIVRRAADDDLSKMVNEFSGKDTNPVNPFMSVEKLKLIPRDGLWIAEVEGEYAGFICWFVGTEALPDGSVDKYGRIQKLWVRTGFYNKKFGE